jgi:lipopolysaccharide export system ATP-binding protein
MKQLKNSNMALKKSCIRAENLVKAYGLKDAVKGVNLTVTAGEVVGLLGPNGAGKTTTFYMVIGLVPVTRGAVYMDEEAVTDLPMYQRARLGMGYLPQEPSTFRKLTVFENIQAIVEFLDIPKARVREVTEEYLKELDLLHLANQKAYTLSGGERRRLEITRALITQPKFLFMDEPFSGVDPISVAEVQEIILSLKKKGIGIIITDHNVRETLRIVDRAYLMFEGKILLEGTSDFLVNDPQSRDLYLGKNFNL